MTNALPAAIPVAAPTELGVSKNLLAIQLVSRDLLTRVQGERIPTALQYQQLTGVGRSRWNGVTRFLNGWGPVEIRKFPS